MRMRDVAFFIYIYIYVSRFLRGLGLSISAKSNFYILITFSRTEESPPNQPDTFPRLSFVSLFAGSTDKGISSAASYYHILTFMLVRGAVSLNHRDSNSGVITCSFFRRQLPREAVVPRDKLCLALCPHVRLSPFLHIPLSLSLSSPSVFVSFLFSTYSAKRLRDPVQL